jgi:hydrogenase/urease accessory protein HupE
MVTRVLPPDRTTFTAPREPRPLEVAADYLKLGVEHIWTGVDHLLFVTGLLLLAGSVRRVLLAITGFTVAHSITLSLSALDLVRLPGPPVEAAIALSILFLAREIARPYPEGLAARSPVLVSSSFGLLHGFGFAAALREAGLPQGEIATGLFCFNLGVEIGQVVFISGVIGLFLALRQAMGLKGLAFAPLQGPLTRLAGYGLGLPAAFWFIQRLVLLAA